MPDDRTQAVSRFYYIVQHFGPIEESSPSKPYNRAILIRTTFEFVRSLARIPRPVSRLLLPVACCRYAG